LKTEILVVIISGCTAIVSALISGIFFSKLTDHRLGRLERNVEKHDELVERMARLEERIKPNVYCTAISESKSRK